MSLLYKDTGTPGYSSSHPLTVLLTIALTAILLFISPEIVQAENTANILFVSSQTSSPYLRFIEKTRLELQAGGLFAVNTTSLTASQLGDASMANENQPYDLIVALGRQAASALQQWGPKAPVLYTLIPKTTYDSLKQSGHLACPGGQCTAIYIDQPLKRLLHIIATAFDGQRHLGVLLGPSSLHQQDTLLTQAGDAGFILHTAVIQDHHELLPALNDILKQSRLLLSIADPVVYNRRTAKSILLTTYRHKVPVIAYSRAYADAGATLSVFSTPEQIAVQATEIIRKFFMGTAPDLPMPQHPERYSIHINQHVAESLGMDLEGNPDLKSIIKDIANEQP